MSQNGLIMFWPPTDRAAMHPTSAIGLKEVLSRETPLPIIGLSWSGHDFLASARNPKLFEQAKLKLLERLGDMPFGIMTDLLASYAKQAVGLSV
jgi:hypothetical protein